jgi:hypothetical protein
MPTSRSASRATSRLFHLPAATHPDDFNDPGQGQRERHDGGQVAQQVVGLHQRSPAQPSPGYNSLLKAVREEPK